MQTYKNRQAESIIRDKLSTSPVVCILGPRQAGKSTLAKKLIEKNSNAEYLDLERPSHFNRLQDPEAYFEANKSKLLCIDEVQRFEELFPILRSVVDDDPRPGRFLLLGSASLDLIRQSSESLAGRVSFIELMPFGISEIEDLNKLWLRGGFPRSYLSRNNEISYAWREDFVRTFLERDIPLLGFNFPAPKMRRFWQMLAHINAQIINFSKLGESMGTSHHTMKNYLQILEQTFMIRTLPPFEGNTKKRLLKSPKVYFRDTGILHYLLGIRHQNDLFGHPAYGSSWEAFALENILRESPNWQASFYRTSSGTEVDLILEKHHRRIGVEFKASSAPKLTKGFHIAIQDLKLDESFVVAPVKESYPIGPNLQVVSLTGFLKKLSSYT